MANRPDSAYARTAAVLGRQYRKFFGAAALEDGSLRLQLSDDGTPFDPVSATPAEKDFDDLDGGGMGIGLILQLAADTSYAREADRNVLTLTLHP